MSERRAWCVRIRDGRLDDWLEFTRSLEDEHYEQAAAQRRRMGFSAHFQSLHRREEGDYVVNFAEAGDLAAGFAALAASEEPFDVWFRAEVSRLYDAPPTPLQGGPVTRTVVDWIDEPRSGVRREETKR